MLNAEIGVGCGSSGGCGDSGGCPQTPDFCMKRHDTRPSFRVSINDCGGAIDLTDQNLVLEASMWFDAKLKSSVEDDATVISFADNLGFEKVLVGDYIFVDRARSVEKMIVSSIDEVAKTVAVQRAQGGTTAQPISKGTPLRIFRFVDSPAEIESVFEDVMRVDGDSVEELSDTVLVFNWSGNQTSLSGCYKMEFKLMMLSPSTAEIEWVKRFPANSEGFFINIIDSATTN